MSRVITKAKIEYLLSQAKDLTKHTEFVIIGSLSIVGSVAETPDDMAMSLDVDLYTLHDPGRIYDAIHALGEESDFRRKHGYYADAVSPKLPTLPDDWEKRLVPVHFDSGTTGWFLSPNDAAVSKYVRGEERDRDWIRAGLSQGVFQLATLEFILRDVSLSSEERIRVNDALIEDRNYVASAQDPQGSVL